MEENSSFIFATSDDVHAFFLVGGMKSANITYSIYRKKGRRENAYANKERESNNKDVRKVDIPLVSPPQGQ